MKTPTDIPPTRTVEPMNPPPPPSAGESTEAMLKADIDSGRTGDKNPVFDPAAAPLGSDDEAAGTPPTERRVAWARRYEDMVRWMGEARRAGAAHYKSDGFPSLYVGFIALIGVVLVAGIWIARTA